MPDYKLSLSYHEDGAVQLHVFDFDDDTDGPLETCSIGEDLDSGALLEAWDDFHDNRRSATEMLRDERERDKRKMDRKYGLSDDGEDGKSWKDEIGELSDEEADALERALRRRDSDRDEERE